MNFDTTVLSLRYGVSRRVNLTAMVPYLSIVSSKIQGAPYVRTNRGLGDLVVMGEVGVLARPQLSLKAGVKLPTANGDKTDDLGQRIDNILALGSGTTDLVLGSSVWLPNAGVRHLDLVAGFEHRVVGGQDKYGYRFGDQTTFLAHASYPVLGRGRVGLRLEGYRTEQDTWYGRPVPERGATMVALGPTASWSVGAGTSVGAFLRVPVAMDLVGAQMVAPSIFGFEMSANLGEVARSVLPGGGEEE